MKSIKSIILALLLIAFVGNYGCDSMDDNFKQYLKEYNYSGKIDSLRVYPGLERVILAWNNPKDQKSKTIKVVYGADSTVLSYDTLVDSISIEGLTAGTGYEFIVYTMDAHNNLSVPTYITAFPISKAFVEALTPPMVVIQTIGPDQFISVMGTSNVLMNFSGNIEYTVSGPDNFSKTDKVYLPQLAGRSQVDIPVTDLIPLPFLPIGDYKIDINVSVWPVQGTLVSVDEVWLSNTQTITVEPVKINLMTIPGSVSDQYNTSGGEGIQMLVDGNPGTKYLCRAQQTWIMWKMDREFIANTYELTSANDADARDPKNWVLEGSNDGSNWTTLDQQSDIKFTSRFQKKIFPLSNVTPYSHYRLRVTANNGDGLFQLAEWTLFYDSNQ
ncbi:DUF4998 domain-containing protein [Proteiniphilum sp.]|uniref:DUF4998 domain-containing protein n=1 Tax=Proteiniphilum sp. TaxID=1926877 RepID=UPI003333A58F